MRSTFIDVIGNRRLCERLGSDLASHALPHALILEGKRRVTFRIPNAQAGALNTLYKNATVEDVEYGAEFVSVTATVDRKVHGMLRAFDPDWQEPTEE